MTRKSPIHHKVRNHNRRNGHVHKYERGHGEKKTTKKRIKKQNLFVTKRKIPKDKKLKFNLWPEDVRKGEPMQMWNKPYKEGESMDLWGKEAKIKPKPKGKPLDYWGEPLEKRPFDPYGPKELSRPPTKEVKTKETTKKEAEEKPFDFWTNEENKENAELVEPPKPPAKEEKPKKEEKELTNPVEIVKKIEEDQKNPKPFDLQEKPVSKKSKKEIPQYTRYDLERLFMGADETEVRNRAKTLGLTFEEERLEPQTGEKVLEYRYPIETDWGADATDRPLAFEEVDITIDLQSGAVTNVWTQMITNPEETGIEL